MLLNRTGSKKIIVFKQILPFWFWHALNNARNIIFGQYIKKKWIDRGSPIPPPHVVKQIKIEEVRKSFSLEIFVETGTYMGDMLAAKAGVFRKLYSIELDTKLYERAVANFKNTPHVEILQGDSGKKLPEVLKKIDAPALFWLDAHYSGGITAKGEKECPIFEELLAIFSNDNAHVILIDDAHCFNGTGDYPELDQLKEFVIGIRPDYKVKLEDNIIILEPSAMKKA